MDNYESIMRNMLVQSIKHEARLSERQIANLEWNQIHDSFIRTKGGREAKLTRATAEALHSMPVYGRYVFSTSTLPPTGVPRPNKTERLMNRAEKLRSSLRSMPKLHVEFR